MGMRRVKVTVTTDGSGAATAYTPTLSGKVHSIDYVKPGATSYTDGVDFAITDEATGAGLWTQSDVNASAKVMPRGPTHSLVGVATLYAAGGTGVLDKVAIAQSRIKIVLAQGGAAKVGAFHFLIET